MDAPREAAPWLPYSTLVGGPGSPLPLTSKGLDSVLSTTYTQPLRRQRDIAQCWEQQGFTNRIILQFPETHSSCKCSKGIWGHWVQAQGQFIETGGQSQRLVLCCRVNRLGPGHQSLLENMQCVLRTSDQLELFSSQPFTVVLMPIPPPRSVTL